MALKKIAVDGCTVTPKGIVSIGIGALTISGTLSNNAKAEGKKVYAGGITFTITGADAIGYDPTTVMTIPATSVTIKPGAEKVRVDDTFVNLENDSDLLVPGPTFNMTGTISGTPTPFFEPFEVTSAGQDEVLAE